MRKYSYIQYAAVHFRIVWGIVALTGNSTFLGSDLSYGFVNLRYSYEFFYRMRFFLFSFSACNWHDFLPNTLNVNKSVSHFRNCKNTSKANILLICILRALLVKWSCSVAYVVTGCYKADSTIKSLLSVIKAVSESHLNYLKPRTQIDIKILPSYEESEGHCPMTITDLSDGYFRSSGSTGWLLSEIYLVFCVWQNVIKIEVLVSYISNCLVIISIEKCSASEIVTNLIFRPIFDISLLLPLQRLCLKRYSSLCSWDLLTNAGVPGGWSPSF